MLGAEWLLGGLAAVGALFLAALRLGKASGRKQEQDKAARGYADTRKRTDDADIVGDDPAASRRWLRERDPDQR